MKRIKKGNFENVAIIGHSSIDPDSISAAFGMEFILKELYPSKNIDILVDGVSKHTSELLNYYDKPYKIASEEEYDLLIIGVPHLGPDLDVEEINDLAKYVKDGGSLLVINDGGGDYENKNNLSQLTEKFGIAFNSDILFDNKNFTSSR